MGHMTKTLYHAYLGGRMQRESFSTFLDRLPKSDNKVANIYLSKLKSMIRGEHLD